MTQLKTFRLRDLPTVTYFGGKIRHTALRTRDALLSLSWIDAGSPEVAAHSHDFEQMTLILDGRMRVTVEGTDHDIGDGEAILIPAGMIHSFAPLGAARIFQLDVFAPPREDYLPLTAHQGYGNGSQTVGA